MNLIHAFRLFCLASILMVAHSAAATAHLERVEFGDMRGWAQDDLGEALAAFRRSCTEIQSDGRGFARPIRFGGTRKDWLPVCAAANHASDPRQFFESQFWALRVNDRKRPRGLFTGYFEPEVRGSQAPSPEFPVPVYRKPADLVAFDSDTENSLGVRYGRIVSGKPAAYFTRKEIEQGALAGKGLEIAWLADWADAFFIHIQGSGRVRLPGGSLMRLAYAAKSGQPYTGIGALLVERGAFSREEMSMQSTRSWMAAHPNEARELMWRNRSFVFFRQVPIDDPQLGPPGAQQVSLTPRRSLAVDRSVWAFGTPVWLDTKVPSASGEGLQDFRHLLIAQDTGSAIKGEARGDVFWGPGDQAALIAGPMKSEGTMIVLLPIALAQTLLGR